MTYTVTIERHDGRMAQAVISAGSADQARAKAQAASPAGFKVCKVMQGHQPHKALEGYSPVSCAMARVETEGKIHRRRSKPAFWSGKKNRRPDRYSVSVSQNWKLAEKKG